MSSSAYYRNLSPTGGRHHVSGPRASTGMVQLGSAHDPYDVSRSRYDYDDHYYPSDVGYSSSHRQQPHHRTSSRVEAQPVSSQKFRDPGHSTKKRTQYTLQPQPQSRHRSHTSSAADLYDTPVRLAVPSSSSGHPRPVVSASRGRSPSPLPSTSSQYLVPHASHSSHRGHRRVYSTDYASDTGRLDPRDSTKHHSPQQTYRPHISSGRRRHPVYDGLKKGDDIDSSDAYSYTNAREQFDRDYPVKPRHPTARSSRDRPHSMNVMDEHSQLLRKERERAERPHGPPPTSWGLDKIDREGRHSSRTLDSHRDGSRTRDASRTRDTSRARGSHDRALVALPHESDDGHDGYESHTDSRHRRHRRHRHESDRHGDDRSPRPHHGTGEQMLAAGLGTAALGAGYADMSDYDHRTSRNRHSPHYDLDREYDSAQPSSRDLRDSSPGAEKKQLYLEPGSASRPRRRSRQRSRGRDSGSDGYTDDEDLRKYRREPSAAEYRSRHSSTDTSSAEDHSSRRHRDRSHPRSSHSQRRLENGHPNGSRHSPPVDGKDDLRKVIAVEPPTTKEHEAAPKSILKPPRQSFPEEPNPVREGVAPLKDATKQGIPPGARWTKIDRRLVNPEALEAGNERFEERSDYVIVLRVLSKEEIQAYAVKTQEIRDARHKEHIDDKRRRMEENHRHGRRGEESSSDDEDEGPEQLKLEAPSVAELEGAPRLPTRPRESNIPPESDRAKAPTAAPAHA